jgi:hypothetical protein
MNAQEQRYHSNVHACEREAAVCVSTSGWCGSLYVCVQSIHYSANTIGPTGQPRGMPLFFLHVRDGVHLILDLDRSCLPDLAAAQAEAVLSARELTSQSIVVDGRLRIE